MSENEKRSDIRWLVMLIAALLLVFVVWAVMNVLVDPFCAYGDRLMHWDSYTQTLNPRNSKAVYLSEHFEDFDAYIIGSSSAASFLPQDLNTYTGLRFYNLFHYGADTSYDCSLIQWLLEQDSDVKEIYLILGLNEANLPEEAPNLRNTGWYPVSGESRTHYLAKYLFASPNYALEKLQSRILDTMLPQTFDVFIPEDGTYDKRVRDVEPIGALADYLALYGSDFPQAEKKTDLNNIEACCQNVSEIQMLCEQKGVRLTVVLPPVSDSQLSGYSTDTINRYYASLSAVTDYWNFQISSISSDPRYFYDETHTRNDTIRMVLAAIFDQTDRYFPQSFGTYCAMNQPADADDLLQKAELARAEHSATVPVLMYHHFDQNPDGKITILNPEAFAHQMQLLTSEGFHPIRFDDLIRFVDEGVSLPENPVLITFDDGYQSNYTDAFPILQEYAFPATIFTIGSSIGHDHYKETDYEITPHFGSAEIQSFLESGLISVQSHSYDMHQSDQYESSRRARTSMLPFRFERQEHYADALKEDIRMQREIFAEYGLPAPYVLSFPGGFHDTIVDVILKENGYRVTLTTEEARINTVVCGLPQSLIDLGRMNVGPETTDQQILDYLRNSAD